MYNTFSSKCSFEVLNHIIIMNWAYPRTQEQIELLYWTPEAWEIEFRYKTMYMKILVNWFLLGDQEAGPTDQAAWPDPWQGAAHPEEGLQLQVFIKFKDLVDLVDFKSTLCSNLEKIRAEAAWSEERQTWRLPDLTVQKTKLPPAGVSCSWRC